MVRYVSPLAFTFVEAKTAHEVRAMSEFKVVARNRRDMWKIPFLKACVTNVEEKVQWQSKRIQMLRMANIAGVSIARVGHRKIEGVRPVTTETDESGQVTKWEKQKVPVYDDLFIDIVPPLDFAVDPNANSLLDAMDCLHFHAEHIDSFQESWSDPRFKHVNDVPAGEEDMIGIAEGFNKIRCEWVIWAFPYPGKTKMTLMEACGAWQEIGYFPLEHGKLPFFSYHNMSSFADVQQDEGGSRTTSGELTSKPLDVRDSETFWTQGVPSVIEDLINLRTDFGRSAYRALDLAGQSIVATAGDYSLDEAIAWQSGKQAIGGKGKLENINLGGGTNVTAFEFVFRDLFEQMILAIGVDPRNLMDTKQKTATESRIQAESSAVRIALIITFNEEHGETMRGQLMICGIQAHYTKMEAVMLTGNETKEDLEEFEEYDKKTSKGKRYRSIQSPINVVETKDGKKRSMKSPKSGAGNYSFFASPETLHTGDLYIRVIPKRRAEQMDSVVIEDLMKIIQMLFQAYPLTVSQMPGVPPAIDPEELPKLGKAISALFDKLGVQEAMPEEKKAPSKFEKLRDAEKQITAQRKPLAQKTSPMMNAAKL